MPPAPAADTPTDVSDERIDPIEPYLSEAWIIDWAAAGVREIEDYLSRHAAFETFLDGED